VALIESSTDGRVRTVDNVAADDGGDDLERADLVGRGRGESPLRIVASPIVPGAR
jgi:hypothetical protein